MFTFIFKKIVEKIPKKNWEKAITKDEIGWSVAGNLISKTITYSADIFTVSFLVGAFTFVYSWSLLQEDNRDILGYISAGIATVSFFSVWHFKKLGFAGAILYSSSRLLFRRDKMYVLKFFKKEK